jgi:hypothetical protein
MPDLTPNDIACARYQPFVVTETGLTPKDPYGWVPTNSDYAEWLDLYERFQILIDANAKIYNDVAQAAWEPGLSDAVESFPVRFDALPSRWNPFTNANDIVLAHELVQAQACALGQIELALDIYDLKAQIPFDPGNPPPSWEPPKDPAADTWGENMQEGAGLGVVLLLGAVAWYYFSKD